MRAYLAILRDSFREALASRVLWILIVLTTLTLAALAPIGITEQAGSRLAREDLRKADQLATRLALAADQNAASSEKHISEQLSTGLRQAVRKKVQSPATDEDAGDLDGRLRNELNELLKDQEFFDGSEWVGVELGPEATALAERERASLADDQVARLNRLALQAAFPEHIRKARRKQVQVTYFHWELGLPLPLPIHQLEPAINQILLNVMIYLLGVGGTLVAILVTAPIVPQTFEQGAVDLLLSKPVTRVGVFLTKYLGGCIFVAINASYFVAGLWLILGSRIGIWNSRLLWCIPVYLFLFMIYYSVSSLAGVVWRSAVMSVVMTVVFWGVCWSLGLAKGLVELFALEPQRIVRLTPAGKELFAVNEQGEILQWQESSLEWEPTFTASSEDEAPPRLRPGTGVIGPVYEATENRLFAIRGGVGRFGALSGAQFHVARPSNHWQRSEGIPSPDGAAAIFIDRKSRVLVIGTDGVFRLEGNPEESVPQPQIFGFRLPVPNSGARFINIGPKLQLAAPLAVAMDPVSGNLALYDGSELITLAAEEDGTYRALAQTTIEDVRAAVLGLSGDVLLFAQPDGTVRSFEPTKLTSGKTYEPEGNNAPRSAQVSPDGRWIAILFHHRRLWVFDTKEKQGLEALVPNQGDVSAAEFPSADKLLVAHHLKRVSRFDVNDWKPREHWTPVMTVSERVYRYFLAPLHLVFPKPSQLDETAAYLLTDQETLSLTPRRDDLSQARIKLDIWNPVWSNLAFVIVVLVAASIYVHRRDF